MVSNPLPRPRNTKELLFNWSSVNSSRHPFPHERINSPREVDSCSGPLPKSTVNSRKYESRRPPYVQDQTSLPRTTYGTIGNNYNKIQTTL